MSMIGRPFGHYQIQERIGAGGMGVVYRALDTQLERTVVIKVIGDDLSGDKTARARLLREARTASSLGHHNICTIFEVGEADGQAYIAMEYIAGRPLNMLIPAGGLPVEAAIRYGIQIADALSHAHERGVVHRDLKSANVIVTPEGHVKVLDFGLAKRLPHGEADATMTKPPLTEAGAVLGTLHYMAPEVLSGAPADSRSDLWALGVVLYELTSGVLPFRGQTGFETTAAILREPLPPLPDGLPAGVQAVIQRLLAKEPSQRYQRAIEGRAALEAVHSGFSAIASASVPVPSRRASHRRWLWPAAAAVLAVAAGAFAVRERETKSPAARVSTGGVASSMPEANEYFERAMLMLKTQADYQRGRPMLERALQIDPRFAEARAWYGFTHLLMFDGGFSNDTSWFFKAEEEIRRALQDDPNSGRAHSTLAAVYFYQGRKDLVPEEEAKALRINPNDIDAPIWLSNYHLLNGDYMPARRLLEDLNAREPLFLVPRLTLAEVARQQGDKAGALREIEKVLEQDPQYGTALQNMAATYQDAGDLSKAREALGRLPPRDQQSYVTRLIWARQFALEGRREDARRQMDDEVLKYAGASPFYIAYVAEVYAVLGDSPKALDWLERAFRLGDERAEWFRRDPLLAGIRNEPGFQKILESIAFRRQRLPDATGDARR